MISDKTVREFQVAVKEEFGADLTLKDAREVLQNWVGYFDLLAKIDARPDPVNEDATPD